MYRIASENQKQDFTMYTDFFTETFNQAAAPFLRQYEGSIEYHALEDNSRNTAIELYSYDDKVTIIPIDEYSDWRNLKAMTPDVIFPAVRELAHAAGSSYGWLVELTARCDGSYRPGRGKLHVTDKGSLKVTIASVEPSYCPIEAVDFAGWVAYRYKFAGAKIE